MPQQRSKRYRQCLEKAPKGKVPLAEAVAAVKSFGPTKFDPTVELAMHLGVDPRQADQALRGSVSLPHGIGKARRVIAFCEGEEAEKAKQAGAVEVGSDELVQKIQDGWADFDVAIAHPQMMKIVSRLGRILGPQGKMPSPKTGTVSADVSTAVREYAAGKVEYRTDAGGNLHVPVGQASFPDEHLVANVDMFISYVKRIRPASAKGTYIRKVSLSATMSPSVEVDV